MFRFLYDLNLPLKSKIEKIAQEMYGAADIKVTNEVEDKVKQLENKVYLRVF